MGIVQALTYEASNCTFTPPQKRQTSEACYITQVLQYENVFQMCRVSNI